MIDFKNPKNLLFFVSAVEGLVESKKHLKQSAHELLLAAKVVNKTTTNIMQDSGLPEALPWLGQLVKSGETILDELIAKTSSEGESLSRSNPKEEAEEDLDLAAPKKIQRKKTKLKVVKQKG